MKTEYERRVCSTTLEARSTNGKKVLVGRAAAYGTLSADLGGFRETIAPGTFSRAIREKHDAVFTLNHNSDALPLGRVSSGTLQLSEDSSGLNCRCDLPNTQAARDLYESVSRGDIREMSFAFSVDTGGDEWGEDTDDEGRKFIKRTLRDVRLHDVAAVLSPAYPSGTNVSALVAQNVSSFPKVSAGALAECRRRGGIAPRPVVAAAYVPSKFDLHQRSVETGKRIGAEDYNAAVRDFIAAGPRPNAHVREK
jgi:HK97 family phage prohead protease